MKKILTSFFLLIIFFFSVNLYSQSVGDYGSVATGNWSSTSTWQLWDGTGFNTVAVTPPAATNNVWVTNGTTVTVDGRDTLVVLTVNTGGTIITPVIGDTLVISGASTVNGYMKNSGGGFKLSGGSLAFGNGSTYEDANSAGSIPTSTWNTGSTCLVTGVTGSTSGINANQNFYNFTWDCTGQTSSVNLAWSGITIGGTVTCNNTGTSQFRWTNNTANAGNPITITINGDVIVNNAALMSTTSSGSALVYTINQTGNISVNGTGQLYVCGTSNSGAYVTWNINGNISAVSGAQIRSSNSISRLKFNSGSTQTMNIGASNVIASNLIFEVANGTTVQLNSPVTISRLVLTSGKIVSTSTNLLTIGSTNSITGGSSTAYVEGPMAHQYNVAAVQSFTFPIAKDGIYRPLTLSLTQSAATTSNYTAEMFNAAPTANSFPGTLDGVSTVRYYLISEGASGSAFTAGSVQLNFDTDDGVSDPTNLRIAQGPSAGGGTWTDLGGTGSAATTGTITSSNAFTDLTTNTVFALADNAGGTNALPVELTSFNSTISSLGVNLQWQTATELNSYGFDVERAEVKGSVAPQFSKIGFVKGSGNSSSTKTYSFTDNTALYGNFQYRLKQVDNSGAFKYSQVIEVNNTNKPLSFAVNQNYPNPFNPTTVINYTLPEASMVTLTIYNVLGEKVTTLVNQRQEKGIYNVSFNGMNLPSGMYIYQLSSGKNVISKKMLLLK